MKTKWGIGHLFFWILIMVLGVATVYPYFLDLKRAVLNRAFFLPVWCLGTYLNWWILMPRYLALGKIKPYSFLLLSMILLLTIAQRYLCLFWFFPSFFWNDPPDPSELSPFLLGPFIQYAAFIALPIFCSIGIYLLMRWYRESYRAKEIVAQQQAAELTYLKAQINPHFLFNTLNSLYGLSLEGSKKVPDMILKLSDILSYTLYESNAAKIGLHKELQLIKDFIALEKERYGERMKVRFKIADDLEENLDIAPLVLIPLVENAFKHGVKEATEIIPIEITLKQENNTLIFVVENEVPFEEPIAQNKKKGLGLKNLQRRLDLLYPQRHSLETERRKTTFFARLKLELDE